MKVLFSIDAHAGGGVCRVLYAGTPPLRGTSSQARRQYFRQNLDWIRRSLMHEPRGFDGAFGAMLGPPLHATSEFSLIFFDPAGYMDNCGHGTLCAIAAWQRMMGGLDVPFRIDNPDGTVTTVLSAEGNGERCTATVHLGFAEVLTEDVELPWKDGIQADVVRCGNTFIMVDAHQLGAADAERLSVNGRCKALLAEIMEAASSAPAIPSDQPLELMVYRRAEDRSTFETAILFNRTQLDRSPCGTGSGALYSLLARRGEIRPGDEILTFGPMKLPFRVVAATPWGDEPGVQVHLSGTAYITGVHEWIIAPDDPLRNGLALEEAVVRHGILPS